MYGILEDSHARGFALQSNWLAMTKQLISSAKHVLETSACTLSTSIALRRFAWLHGTTFDMRALVEDMAFDGQGLFNVETDSALCRLEKDI